MRLDIYQLSHESYSFSAIQPTQFLLLMHLQPFSTWEVALPAHADFKHLAKKCVSGTQVPESS